MRVIDIDQLVHIENHIHYIKEYKGSLILMDKTAKIVRNPIKFSIEYKPMGSPDINIDLPDLPQYSSNDSVVVKIKEKIIKLDSDGTLSSLLKS